MARNAIISKTVRFTDAEWARWGRMIGKRYLRTWADVVNAALTHWEAELMRTGDIDELMGARATNHVVAAAVKEPSAPVQLPPPPDTTVVGMGQCKECGRHRLLNSLDICDVCEVVRHSGGTVTTGDKVPAPDKSKRPQKKAKGATVAPQANGKAKAKAKAKAKG